MSADIKNASGAWSAYYKDNSHKNNIFPESFIARIFLSTSPVSYLEQNFSGKKILDLGCGHGRHIPFLSGLGLHVDGMEVSEEQVNSLRGLYPSQNFYCGKSASIPSEDRSYDYVMACNSIYYIDDLSIGFSKHLEEVYRVLKDDGIFIFSMVGAQHSILQRCDRVGEYAHLNYDFLGFREGTVIRPLWNKSEAQDILSPYFHLHKSGEILETSEEFVRHIHYMVAHKKA